MRLLYLDLDTLRPDHLGCYGYHRNTSPNIDRIAAAGVRFDNYYCSDAPCLPSRAALMTGRFGIHSGIVGHGGTAADLRLTGASRGFRDALFQAHLPAFLRNAGLSTICISPFAERHSAWWFYAGFLEMYDTGQCGMESAEQVTPIALDWIERNARRDNWYLHVNYWDPHTPYRAPAAFGNPFAADPPPAWLTAAVLAEHRRQAGPHGARELRMYRNDAWPEFPRYLGEIKDLNDWKHIIDGYDCGIRYMDDHIGLLLDALARQGVLDDLAIVISADHGENLGELGIYAEHATADQSTCRIPMIVRWRGKRRGAVDDGLHYNLDLLPTLAELLGRERHVAWDGASFAPALEQCTACGRPELIVSQCAHVCQRGVRFDNWMFIRTRHDGYHLFPDEMLFDIKQDPHEQVNLAERRPEICREAMDRLNRWRSAMLQSMPDAVDPLETVMREGGPFHARGELKNYCARLEATERGWAVPELKRRHPREFA